MILLTASQSAPTQMISVEALFHQFVGHISLEVCWSLGRFVPRLRGLVPSRENGVLTARRRGQLG